MKTDISIGLRSAFRSKSDYQLQALFDALDSDEPKELVNYAR
jgi:hypothetical protein